MAFLIDSQLRLRENRLKRDNLLQKETELPPLLVN